MNNTLSNNANEVQQVANQIEESVQQGKYTWRQVQNAIVEKTRQAAATTNHYAHEKPWPLIGVAAAVGLVLGLLAAPRSGD